MKRALSLAIVCALACGGSDEAPSRGVVTTTEGGERVVSDGGRCEAGASHEVSEYDTNGDEYPDVRKVYLVVGEGRLTRLVLVCREADLNDDGVKDVVRFYNDEGRPLREESDRDFDGRVDSVSLFERGQIVIQELDENRDGRVDTKLFFDNGTPVRAERDLGGRSTADNWQPDRWEYYEEGRIIRMGTDLDGDGSVDRWDRDAEWQHQREQERLEERRAQEEAAAAEDGAA